MVCRSCVHPWKAVVFDAIEQAAGGFLADAVVLLAIAVAVAGRPFSELFEEERHASRIALITKTARPGQFHRAGCTSAFASDDDPIENDSPRPTRFRLGLIVWAVLKDSLGARAITSRAVRLAHFATVVLRKPRPQINRPQQRLCRNEPDRRRRLQQQRNALVGFLLALAGDAEPDVRERPDAGLRVKAALEIIGDVENTGRRSNCVATTSASAPRASSAPGTYAAGLRP